MIDLLPLTADAPYFADAVAVYTEYVPTTNTRYHAEFFRSHMQRPGYVGLVARIEENIVGLAFGSDSLPGQWWYDKVASHVDAAHPALQDAWVLTQLNVLAAYRNQGIGTILHDAVIARQPRTHLLLSTQVSNTSAQRFYRRHCWQVLHPGFVFSNGDEPYMIMYRSAQQ